ncbi:MAG: 50S ribosomal protein L18 [Dehalococcoidia bacterium]|nr:50S ribosomal protein L18 [Dehalococcoidia bacterium]
MAKLDTRKSRQARHRRIRARVSGTADRPRLCVFRSLNHIYAQVIDDAAGRTVAAASTLSSEANTGSEKDAKLALAEKVGALIGKIAQEKGVSQVVFDRGGYKYHGRVKALADGARKAGLKF